MAPALIGGNKMVWTEMRLTMKGLETGTDCVKYTVLYRKRGLGVREDHLEVRLDWTSMAFEQGSGSGFKAGNLRDEGGIRDEHCGSYPDANRACAGVSGSELSGPSRIGQCDAALNRLPIVLLADPLSSWHVAYICSFVTFRETNNSRWVKRWQFPVLQSKTLIRSCFPATCQK